MKSHGEGLAGSLFMISLFGCARPAPLPEAPETATAPQQEYEIKMGPSGVKHIIVPERLLSGGPPKDSMPSIDAPKFVPLLTMPTGGYRKQSRKEVLVYLIRLSPRY
jgi:hypothetical protein